MLNTNAAQGDGELDGNALETPMDVEITVDLVSQLVLQTSVGSG